MSSDKKRVRFRASDRLVNRADVLAEDRTGILVTALREYLRAATHDDALTREIAAAYYDDVHGDGAGRVLGRTDSLSVRAVDPDTESPLNDGENAAVTLANQDDATILLCDEFNRLGPIRLIVIRYRHAGVVGLCWDTRPQCADCTAENSHDNPYG